MEELIQNQHKFLLTQNRRSVIIYSTNERKTLTGARVLWAGGISI